MINKIKEWSGLVALIAIILFLVFSSSSLKFGVTGTRFPNGLSADTTSPVAGELRGDDLTLDDDAVITDDLTVSGGSVVVTTSNSATSTVSLGCIQTVATSTATAIRLIIGTSNTAASSTWSTATNGGFVNWGYGSCPN